MTKSEATVQELVEKLERGSLVLPEMQRRYVWRSSRVRDLLDSLYRGYPSGSILLWETDEDVPLQNMAIEQEKSPLKTNLLLLDGQQRLTALSAVIRGKPLTVRDRQRSIELLFNLEHPEDLSDVTEVNEDGVDEEDDEETLQDDEAPDSTEDELMQRFNRMTFVVAAKKLAQLPHWVSVSEVFRVEEDLPFLLRAGVKDLGDPRVTKYSQRLARLRAIKKYTYKYDVLDRSLSYDEVTEIFVRVNSYGAKLRSSDLALAQITAKWRGSLKIFQEYQSQCSKAGYDFDLGIILRNMIAFATSQSRFATVGGQSIEKLKVAWAESKKGMDFALNFLKSNCGIECEELLSSPFLVVALGYYGFMRKYKISAVEAGRLRYWVLVANAKGHYSRGSSETILDQDLATLRDGGDVEQLLERLTMQVGRLDITPEDLEGRTQRSALFKTMFLAFRYAGARDWYTNLAIALNHTGTQHKLQFHHIFAKGLLKGLIPSREAEDISNLSFISGSTNRDISDKPPSVYFPSAIASAGEASFTAQCIPVDSELLGLDQYKAFLAVRRKLISARLNEFLTKE